MISSVFFFARYLKKGGSDLYCTGKIKLPPFKCHRRQGHCLVHELCKDNGKFSPKDSPQGYSYLLFPTPQHQGLTGIVKSCRIGAGLSGYLVQLYPTRTSIKWPERNRIVHFGKSGQTLPEIRIHVVNMQVKREVRKIKEILNI